MVWGESQHNFTKDLVTFASGGGRRSSWALGYVEFPRQSISDTLGAIPRTLGALILEKAPKTPNPPQTGHFGFGEYLSIREPTVNVSGEFRLRKPPLPNKSGLLEGGGFLSRSFFALPKIAFLDVSEECNFFGFFSSDFFFKLFIFSSFFN